MPASMPPNAPGVTAWSAKPIRNTSPKPAARWPSGLIVVPADDTYFLRVAFFFLAACFLPLAFLTDAVVFPDTLAFFRDFGRLRTAARCAAAKAVLAHSVNSCESSYRRAGNSQYELTVTTFPVDFC